MIKEKVKALWRLCFDDSEEFINMYFRLRYNNEVNIAIKSGDEIISALQMLPYPMTFCGKTIQTSYISGACTHPDYRGKGVMRELLSQAFSRMTRNGIALSTLIPAEPWLFDYYARMGYAPVFRYSKKKVSEPYSPTPGIFVKKMTNEHEEVYQYLNRKMSERPCCIQHTPTDFKVILADLKISEGILYVAIEKEKIAGIAIVYPQKHGLEINELFAETKEIEEALLCQIQQEAGTDELTILTPPMADNEQRVLGMARIIDAKTILQLYATFYPDVEMNIELTDKMLVSNNGHYYLCKGKCMFSKERLPGSHLQLTIEELCEKIITPLRPYMSLMLD
ncbi:GNAT family N-acetyltransferase [Bacteroides sp.]